jgi:hypothetical protein
MKTRLVVLTVLVLAFSTVVPAAEDPFIGTWKLNVGKSSKTNTPSQSDVAHGELVENGYKIFRDVVSADGKKEHTEQIITFDGKEYPAPAFPGAIQSCSRINAYAYVCTVKRDGKEMAKIYDVTSSDGTTGTLIMVGKNLQGKELVNTFVYEKQ